MELSYIKNVQYAGGIRKKMSNNEIVFKNDYLIKEFLKTIKKRSTGSYENHKANLRLFFDYIKNKNIGMVTMFDVRDYFIEILDKQEIKISTKNTKRFMLKSFFDYVEKMFLEKNIIFPNPVPSTKIFDFTRLGQDIIRSSRKELKILSHEQIGEILYFAENSCSERDFIILLLIICTGARISEIRTILKEDVSFVDRFFETGFSIDARKSTLKKGESLIFFFPEGIIKYLKGYMKKLNFDNPWLFPGYKKNSISHQTAHNIYKDISKNIGINFSWHYFRRTIITERRKMGCPEWISEGLMNHTPSSVERESYIKLKISEKREYYDQYFPYADIIYFTI